MPPGAFVDPGNQSGRRRHACRCLDEAANFLLVQAAEGDLLADRFAQELGEQIGQRMPPRQGHVAERADDQEWNVAQASGDKLQEQKRRPVGTLEIVEYEDDRARPGCAGKEGGDPVEKPEPG